MPVQVRPPAFEMKTDLLVIRERFFLNYAGMAELADAPDLGSGVHDVQVQVLLPAVNECSCKSMESILQLFFYARNLLKYFLK